MGDPGSDELTRRGRHDAKRDGQTYDGFRGNFCLDGVQTRPVLVHARHEPGASGLQEWGGTWRQERQQAAGAGGGAGRRGTGTGPPGAVWAGRTALPGGLSAASRSAAATETPTASA